MILPYFKVMGYISLDLFKKLLNYELNSIPIYFFNLYFSHLLIFLLNYNRIYFLAKFLFIYLF